MHKLTLLFTKDSLQWAINKVSSYREESFFEDKEISNITVFEKLGEILKYKGIRKINIISAYNSFSILPYGFEKHNMGHKFISYNTHVDNDSEELMLAVNKRFNLQFYYTLPKIFYYKIKSIDVPLFFNFSGERFLSRAVSTEAKEQLHINLYHNQVEFFIVKNKNIILYNNLDANSDVDFLYFIMFAISKLNLDLKKLQFLLYGEIDENETFVSELQKFAENVFIVEKNIRNKRNFILQ